MRLTTRLLVVIGLGSMLAACASSPPSKFYTLAGTSTAGATPVPTVPVFIEMLPVSVSERLARPQIVLRADNSQLDIREQDRWASPFNVELRDALVAAIVGKTGGTDVTKSGRPTNTNAYRVALDLQQYEAVLEQQVHTVFGWTITRSDGAKSVVCKLVVDEPVNRGGVDAVVDSVQRVVGKVSTVIANEIVALENNRTPACQ